MLLSIPFLETAKILLDKCNCSKDDVEDFKLQIARCEHRIRRQEILCSLDEVVKKNNDEIKEIKNPNYQELNEIKKDCIIKNKKEYQNLIDEYDRIPLDRIPTYKTEKIIDEYTTWYDDRFQMQQTDLRNELHKKHLQEVPDLFK